MAYKISFTDRSVILTTTEQGDKLKEAQMQSKPPVYVDIDKNQYKLAGVAKIEYIADEPITKLLPEPPRCHGEKSIHLVIYEEYKKRLRAGGHTPYKEFRQKAYDLLYEKYPKKEWCDHRRGACFCETTAIVNRVSEVMGAGVEVV